MRRIDSLSELVPEDYGLAHSAIYGEPGEGVGDGLSLALCSTASSPCALPHVHSDMHACTHSCTHWDERETCADPLG